MKCTQTGTGLTAKPETPEHGTASSTSPTCAPAMSGPHRRRQGRVTHKRRRCQRTSTITGAVITIIKSLANSWIRGGGKGGATGKPGFDFGASYRRKDGGNDWHSQTGPDKVEFVKPEPVTTNKQQRQND